MVCIKLSGLYYCKVNLHRALLSLYMQNYSTIIETQISYFGIMYTESFYVQELSRSDNACCV